MTFEDYIYAIINQELMNWLAPTWSLGIKTWSAVTIQSTPLVVLCNFNATTGLGIALK